VWYVSYPLVHIIEAFPSHFGLHTNKHAGINGEAPVSLICPASAGDTLTFEFREYPDASQPSAIDPSHKGPCAVYMKYAPFLLDTNQAAGPGWFKIFYDGYDSTTNKWCTEKLIDNNGHLSVPIPKDLLGGYYLIRPELLALHDASASPPDTQFYAGCAQVFLKSSGTANPTDTVDIPGNYVNYSMPSMIFSIWDQPMHLPYHEFGPPGYKAGGPANHASGPASQTQFSGLKPDNTVLVNANWCGIELPDYNNQNACWSVSEGCWNQSAACYASSGPTGSKNCHLWDAKCQHNVDLCNAGNFVGPADKGKDLTPQLQDLGQGQDQVSVKRRIGKKFVM
jgi:hypothetical protein